MAVSVPRLQRIQPSQALPANERIQIQAPDASSAITSRTNAVAGLAEKGIDLYYDMEDSQITQLSNKAEQDYTSWQTDRLSQLKNYQGDPTEAYAAFDIEAKAKKDEILSAHPDLNERMKSHITSNLDKTIGTQNLHVLKQRGAQVEVYKNENFESHVKLKKTELGTNIGYVNASDPGSFLPMDQNIADIKTTIAKRGFEIGIAKKLPDDAKSWNHIYSEPEIGEDGKPVLDSSGNPKTKLVKVELSDMAKQKAAKELSEGVRESLNAMLATSATPEARANYEAAYEKYKPYLDPKAIASLNKGHKESIIKDTAYSEVGRIELLSPEKQVTEIEKISDPEVKAKVLQIKDTNDARRQHMKKRQEEVNGDLVAKEILKTPMYGIADLENNEVFKRVKDKLNPKQIEAYRDSVVAPKHSDPKAVMKMQDLITGNDPDNQLEAMSSEKLLEYKRGLSKSDQSKLDNYYLRLGNESASEERSTHKRAEMFLKDQLLSDKYIKKDEYGRLMGKNELKYIEARNEMLNKLSTAKKNMSDIDLMNFAKEYSASKIKGEVFTPKARGVFNEPSVPKENNAIIPSPNQPFKEPVDASLSLTDSLKLRQKYKQQFKEWPDLKSQQYLNFVKANPVR